MASVAGCSSVATGKRMREDDNEVLVPENGSFGGDDNDPNDEEVLASDTHGVGGGDNDHNDEEVLALRARTTTTKMVS